MSYSDEVIKVRNTVHELKGRCDRLESEVGWLRETVASLMMKMTMPLQTLPAMTLEDWSRMTNRGPWGLTVGDNVAPLTTGTTGGK
jgi:hypothetical protein